MHVVHGAFKLTRLSFINRHRIQFAGKASFSRISQKLSESDGYMYIKKLFKELFPLTYSETIEIGEDAMVPQVQSKFFYE